MVAAMLLDLVKQPWNAFHFHIYQVVAKRQQ
jgi:hypothetical protein